MFGAILKGGAWCATGALTTIGALTFVPDDAWKSFPDALAPVRTALAQIGVAPPQYSPNGDGLTFKATNVEENRGFFGESSGANGDETARARTLVRVGRRNCPDGGRFLAENGAGLDVDSVARKGAASENPELSANYNKDFQGVESDLNDSDFLNGAENTANTKIAQVAAVEKDAKTARNAKAAQDPASSEEKNAASTDLTAAPTENGAGFAQDELNGETSFDFNSAPSPEETENVASEEYFDSDEIPPFDLENLTETLETPPTVDVANEPNKADSSEISLNSANSFSETSAPSANETPFVSASSAQSVGDFASELENALKEAEALEAARQNDGDAADLVERTKNVFLTLNRIRRDERGATLSSETTARLNGALDRLAFEIFYNPRTAILEPFCVVASGDSLASIAAKFSITPETLGAINGLDVAPDAPLPLGATLKTVRGPVAAELSASKKELLLTFNGLYAGRFAFGLPEKAATLRGKFVVSGKIVNPPCDAVDAAGNPISIPGGSPENPLGAAWIALADENGGSALGLQGTNRPELVGKLVRENGGILFSDREIMQLNVLLPIGAEIVFVD